jgi:uncharacterized protein (TIGR02118 family)
VARHKVIVADDGRPAMSAPGLTYLPLVAGEATVRCLWLDDLPDPATIPGRAWLVEERALWDELDGPGITRFSFLRRANGLTRADFARHWTEVHAPLARVHHPALRRYVQNIVVEPLGNAEDIDGIVELGFATALDLEERMYDSDEGRAAVAADVKTFLDVGAGWRVVTVDPDAADPESPPC